MEKLYLAGLHSIGFTHKKLFKIFENKQNYKDVFVNLNYDFLNKNGFLEKQIKMILENSKKIKLDNIEKKLKSRKVRIITVFDEEYPKNLNNINNKPFLFYIRGKIDNSPKLSII
jgi:DNA processing protein